MQSISGNVWVIDSTNIPLVIRSFQSKFKVSGIQNPIPIRIQLPAFLLRVRNSSIILVQQSCIRIHPQQKQQEVQVGRRSGIHTK